jgi:CRP/FNR family cyclic AMP-dependent transcriptional regulator
MLNSLHSRTTNDCEACELRSLRKFCDLNDAALQKFQSIGVAMTATKGTKLFLEDQPCGSVFVICAGQVKLYCTSKDGKNMILKIALPGDVLGLSAMLATTKYEVTAEVIQPTHLKRIRQDEFFAFLREHGEGSLHAAQAMSEEYKAAFFDIRRLALSVSAAARLANLFLEWGRSEACGNPEMRFTMALTHEELADMIGSSRETITRTMSQLKRDNIIATRGTSMVIVSPEKLENISA